MIGRSEIAKPACQPVGNDGGGIGLRDLAIVIGQLRRSRRAAPQKVDERVFEPGPCRHQRGPGCQAQRNGGWHRRIGPDHQPQRIALHRAVDHGRIVQRVAQGHPPAGAGHANPEHPVADRVGQVLRGAIVQRPALVQQRDRVALFRLVEIGGGPQHADAVAGQILDHGPQFAPRHRVDPDAGFIEQQQVRGAHHGAGQAQLLLHPARQLARQSRGKPAQIGEIEQPVEARPAFGRGQSAQIGIQRQVFDHRQVFIEAKALRHVSDHRAVGVGCRAPEHRGAAPIGVDQAGQDADQGGFARSIGTDQSGHPARLDPHRHRIQRRDRLPGKPLGQRGNAGDRVGHVSAAPQGARRAPQWSPARPGATRRRGR